MHVTERVPTRRSSWWAIERIVLPAMLVLGGLALCGMDWPLVTLLVRVAAPAPAVKHHSETAPAPSVVPAMRHTALGVEIIPRDRWRAHPPKGRPAPLGTPAVITVHHQGSAPFTSEDLEVTARRIRNIQRFHQTTRRWLDIAYHFVVDRAGRIWEGRPLDRIGSHAGSRRANRNNLGIVLLGNFDLQRPTPAQADALRRILEACCDHWNIPRRRVFTHNEIRHRFGLSGTACPGEHVAEIVRAFRGA